MADMTQFSGGDSKHLKAQDFLGKKLKLTISEVQFVEFDSRDGGPPERKAILLFEGKDKGVVLNVSNVKKLVGAYGNDSDSWLGKEIGLTTQEYDAFPAGWVVNPLEVQFDDEIPF